MTAATITKQLEINDPSKEVVLLTVTDGETYTSKKLGLVRAVQATFNEDQGTLSIPLSCAISGPTVTVHGTGVSDQLVCLTLYGNK